MSPITLEALEAKQTELSQLIAKFKEQPMQPLLHVFSEVQIELHPGEHYAGPVLDESGKVTHHLVLMAQRPESKLAWQDAMDWAENVGGALPNRQEQALLYANCKTHLEAVWHWSCETYEEDASYAWSCYFDDGNQYDFHKSYEGGVVAVRRIHVTA